jgi:hypothetical protein
MGLMVPVLLVIGNRQFGTSGSLRGLCAAIAPGKIEFFNYDWRNVSGWSIALVAGVFLGGVIAATLLGVTSPAISPATRDALARLGLGSEPTGLAPAALFSWKALLTVRGVTCIVGGGFLAGFGATYAGGCTSGHGITGLASRQLPSLIAVVAIFAGGIATTFVLMPLIF